MDSKYSIGNKNSSISSSSGLKRKFTYNSPSNVPTKRPTLQSIHKPLITTPKNVSSTSSNSSERPIPKDIQQQRQQLPVYAVKDS